MQRDARLLLDAARPAIEPARAASVVHTKEQAEFRRNGMEAARLTPVVHQKGTYDMSLKRFSKKNAVTGRNAARQISIRIAAAALTVCSLGLGLAFKAAASLADRKTIVTFNTPVELPGKALPAGTYVFKVLDDTGRRDVVQVFDKDEKQLLATLLAIPDYRDTPPAKPIVNFEERSSDTPPAVKALYFPGDTYGLEFVYPKDRATQIAKRTGQNVLSMSNNNTQNITAPATSANAGSVQQMEKTDVTGVDPSGAPVEVMIIVGSKPER
jgi:hypothetical protein